ncbi:hypothetical protein N321_09194, partial [Antrostomus carolinensis]
LTAEAVEGASLALKGVHHVHGRHRLPLGVLGVGDGVADHVLQEHLQHQAADGRLSDALDVVAQHLAVALGAPFAEPLPALA